MVRISNSVHQLQSKKTFFFRIVFRDRNPSRIFGYSGTHTERKLLLYADKINWVSTQK